MRDTFHGDASAGKERLLVDARGTQARGGARLDLPTALDVVALAVDHGGAVHDEQRMRIAEPPLDDFARDLDVAGGVEASRHGVMSPCRAESRRRNEPGREKNLRTNTHVLPPGLCTPTLA